jgi:class 3 adenylate cyclase/tetratricopeptide (TPR) repeat protein
MTSCPRCGGAATETASYCSSCGARLTREPARSAPQARKTVTVMFADVSAYTSLAEQNDPESVQQLMAPYFATMRAIVARHGGTVEKLIGDAVMALFGVPVVHEDDALRAARAALEMHAALDRLNDELGARWDVRLQIHTGLNTGEVVVGLNSAGEREAYGDAVNVAQRLQVAAPPGQILVGPLTARLLHGVARLSPLVPFGVKGRTATVAAWRLDGMGDDERRTTGPVSGLVGRRAERAALGEAFDAVVASRRPAMVTIVGAAGIGKSRLAQAMTEDLADRAVVVTGRCLPYGEGITYWPLTEIVRRLAGRADETALAAAAGGGAEARSIAQRVARVVGVTPGNVAVEEAHWAVRRLLEIRAAQRPLVVVVDDIHWAEPTLLDLLEHLAAASSNAPLLLVCLARPDLLDRRPRWTGDAAPGAVMTLDPLADEDAAVLLRRLTADADLEPHEIERLLATAEGNPFFLEQIVAMRAEPAEREARLPASIQALLAARVDTLPASERAVIDRASVEGRGFHRSAIEELLHPDDRQYLDASLDSLVRRQLIRPAGGELPGEPGYEFAHILVRDVVYELMPKARRGDVHERYAAWLERRTGVQYGEVIGYHLEQAHRLHAELRPMAGSERRALAAAAARWLGAAARAALDRGDPPAGVNLLERTAALLPADAPERVAALPTLGLALVQLGRLRDAENVLIEAATNARLRGDEAAEAHARAAHLLALVQVDPETAAEQLAARSTAMRRTLAAAADDVGLARLYRAEALQYWMLGRTAQAEAAWMRGMRHSRQAGDEQGVADSFVWLASAALVGPTRVPPAISWCTTILDHLRADRRSLALSMRPLAGLHAMAGRFDVAAELFAESRAIHDTLGVGMHAAVAQDEALVALAADDPRGAEALLLPGLERLEAIGERAFLATTAGILAIALIEQDRDDEAWDLTRTTEEAAAEDDLSPHILWRMARARLLARRGERSDAERLSREAVALAARTDWLVDRGDALMVHGEVLAACGQDDAASAAIREALELYSRKGNVAAAQRARTAGGHPRFGRETAGVRRPA